MGRSGSHKLTSALPPNALGRGAASLSSTPKRPSVTPEARVADLEAQLALATQTLQSQRASYDEDLESFEKALARVAQSERSLSQTKARLVDAEAQAHAEHARAEALAAELVAVKATAAAEIARAKETVAAVGEREQQAQAAARAARFELAANVAELEELQGKVSDLRAEHALQRDELKAERALCEVDLEQAVAGNERLQADLTSCRAEVAAARERNALLLNERTRLLGLLASLEVLAREITHLTAQASTATPALPQVEAWLGRDVEAEHVRATMRPEGPVAPPAPQPSRALSAPEITVDGLELEP